MKWVAVAVLAGIIYVLAGFVFGELAAAASSDEAAHFWWAMACMIGGITFFTQILYELRRLGSLPRAAALHVALTVALGAFALAISALVRQMMLSHTTYLAFIVWPVVIGISAFAIAWAFAALIARGESENTDLAP
jgi:uncharacterized membrane protein